MSRRESKQEGEEIGKGGEKEQEVGTGGDKEEDVD
jgi:hypothetical protein